ncbi:bifunctional metallophosphatase/5'-nucleotidase [Litchfieldia salsa]|uniref:2',3'-cyclic-nucleotide 2'-phosphodiesterase / 3'-nucleotidase n=1 Tax=Litchfieldia salsa TaxID=930152 RepID=A0A1H0U0A5_9BACI|nr:bifunctional UDP-sugar hydrolase/5'-nucleotidase [Litchfieldia salsa]SDP59633.1 2',3'-cyclic-nucleotide 2'-phosphodiesterase / 3'-nucleotidase [Litchfieldia salsa]
MKDIKLTILETSDLHGHIYPIHYGTNEYQPLGLAKIATYIEEVREQEPHTLLIDNGDQFQGTPLTYHYVRNQSHLANPVTQTLNHLHYDAAVIGNHEFNYGMQPLNQAVSESNFPWLSANIVDSVTNEPYFGQPYLIKKLTEDFKVAILGLTTHYIPNWEKPEHIKDLAFEDCLESAARWVSYIRTHEQPDLLIVSYHGGFEKNLSTGEPTETLSGENQAYEICQKVEGIDVLLTGHQHRLLADEVNGVSIVQPGCNGAYVGRVDLHFQQNDLEKWVCIHKQSSLVPMESHVAHETIQAINQVYEEATQTWLDQPIGKIEGNMVITDAFHARLEEHPLVEFINNVQMDVADVDISNTALFNNQARGLPTDVTMRDIVSNYIYPNTLTVLEVTGRDIKEALERSASYFIIREDGEIDVNPSFYEPKPQHYNYDMWEGIDYTINVAKPIGQRVTSLTKDGSPLAESQTYQVVMNNYRATGGGEYHMFKGKKVVKEIQIDMTEILANYFVKHPLIKAETNQNWRVVKG